jgi:glycosyltransferase involved in cell wall biosynthesis
MQVSLESKRYSTNYLLYKFIDNSYLGKDGKIREELRYRIVNPVFKIQDSKFLKKPEDKFETLLFLPPNSKRLAEGGLRTKGFFKFSYKLIENRWYMCDIDGNPVIPAPEEIQKKIITYLSDFSLQSDYANKLPLMTIVTVVLNGADLIEETIRSVLEQNYPNVEYIIVDGGSTDGTVDIIRKYENFIDYWVSEPDGGIYDAMNKALDVSTGYIINFLNSGDKFYDQNVLLKVFSEYSKIPEDQFDIIYGKCVGVDIYGNTIYMLIRSENEAIPMLKKGMSIPHQTTFYKLTFFKRQGKYSTDYKISADYEILLRSYRSLKVKFIDEILSVVLGGGISERQIFKEIFEFMMAKVRNRKELGLGFSQIFIDFLYQFWFYAKREIKMVMKGFIKSTLKKLGIKLGK